MFSKFDNVVHLAKFRIKPIYIYIYIYIYVNSWNQCVNMFLGKGPLLSESTRRSRSLRRPCRSRRRLCLWGRRVALWQVVVQVECLKSHLLNKISHSVAHGPHGPPHKYLELMDNSAVPLKMADLHLQEMAPGVHATRL
jgi:hypothetical protein